MKLHQLPKYAFVITAIVFFWPKPSASLVTITVRPQQNTLPFVFHRNHHLMEGISSQLHRTLALSFHGIWKKIKKCIWVQSFHTVLIWPYYFPIRVAFAYTTTLFLTRILLPDHKRFSLASLLFLSFSQN